MYMHVYICMYVCVCVCVCVCQGMRENGTMAGVQEKVLQICAYVLWSIVGASTEQTVLSMSVDPEIRKKLASRQPTN